MTRTAKAELQCSGRKGHEPAVALLLALKPSQVYARDHLGNTLLHLLCCQSFSNELIERVWAMNKAALRVANKYGSTPFSLALQPTRPWAVEFFESQLTEKELVEAFSKLKARKGLVKARRLLWERRGIRFDDEESEEDA